MTGAAVAAIIWRAFTPDSNDSGRWHSKVGRLLIPYNLLLAGWLFLFFLLVGVYYHLMPMVVIPLLFVSRKHPWRSLAAVVIASLWAGVSRVNWFPVPAMIAIALYLLEVPLVRQTVDRGRRKTDGQPSTVHRLFTYLKLPALWAISGLLSALGGQAAYIFLSGNADNAKAFASSFTSDLIWPRLWPNELYPLGILSGILLVCAPLLGALALALTHWKRLHPVRWAGILSMLAVLFAGGLVVSVKIGGGGDLHNMDGFAVLLSVVAALFIGGQARAESAADEARVRVQPSWPLMALAALIPLFFLIPMLAPRPVYDKALNQARFDELKSLAEGADGPVLFINERHFVTFGDIDVPLAPDYENVTLMEMAMSNNLEVLRQFYADLRENRFALIVARRQNLLVKEEGVFAEENNVWNERVSPYILCYYEELTLIEPSHSRLAIYVPRAEPGECP
jgi:hypothetical protein